MKFGVVVFPGTWSDVDCYHVLKNVFQQPVEYVWHRETDLSDFDCVVLPGGFSYGDYLRTGAIAKISPVMGALKGFVGQGKLVAGICNGFQVLCEAGFLPGALLRNSHLQFRCQWVNLRTENCETAFTNQIKSRQILSVPISHGEGNYYADSDTISELEDTGRILFRYSTEDGEITLNANPNGSLSNIAGITNAEGNVMGMMPHPERCCESILGGDDGRYIFESLIKSLTS